MFHLGVILIASLPLLARLAPLILPAPWLEPYFYWDAEALNLPLGKEREDVAVGERRYWRNQGYWEGTTDYPTAAEALARKLLDFAEATPGGSVLDIAHGTGESLVLHLSQSSPPRELHALTSLPSETTHAQSLISARIPNSSLTEGVEWYTASASFSPQDRGKSPKAHPLDPMRGFLGSAQGHHTQVEWDEDDDDDSGTGVERETETSPSPAAPPRGFDLIYILDAIYHFPPHVPHFLLTAKEALAPGGVVGYTDILPPPNLSPVLAHLLIAPLLSVPARNLVQRPKDIEAYELELHRMGFVDVKVEDWTENVFPGFGKFLRTRGKLWTVVARGVEWAERSGWKFVAVRARRAIESETELPVAGPE